MPSAAMHCDDVLFVAQRDPVQESYQSSLLAEELEHFLAISGISRALFNNLAAAYKGVTPLSKSV